MASLKGPCATVRLVIGIRKAGGGGHCDRTCPFLCHISFLWESHREASWSRIPLPRGGGRWENTLVRCATWGLAFSRPFLSFLSSFFGPSLFFFLFLLFLLFLLVSYKILPVSKEGGRSGTGGTRRRGGTGLDWRLGFPEKSRLERLRGSRCALKRPPYCNAAYSFEGDASSLFFLPPCELISCPSFD